MTNRREPRYVGPNDPDLARVGAACLPELKELLTYQMIPADPSGIARILNICYNHAANICPERQFRFDMELREGGHFAYILTYDPAA